MTVFDATSSSFKTPAPNLSQESLDRHIAGDAQFEATFVTAPAPVHPRAPAAPHATFPSFAPGSWPVCPRSPTR
ncbi:MAG: di-heme oxidoredictase family protein [Gemmatimonadales bacterium]